MLAAAALHIVAAHCTRSYAAILQPFCALRVYAVQVVGFVAAVLVGGAVAGLLGGGWGGLGGGFVGLASGTGIRECLFGWLVAVIPAWPGVPGPVAGFSIDADTALLIAATAHLSTRTTVYAVAYAIVWIAGVTYAGWAGAFLARRVVRRRSTGPACKSRG
jgi:hypothetical protein